MCNTKVKKLKIFFEPLNVKLISSFKQTLELSFTLIFIGRTQSYIMRKKFNLKNIKKQFIRNKVKIKMPKVADN